MPRVVLRTFFVLFFPALVSGQELRVKAPSLVLAGLPFKIEVQVVSAEGAVLEEHEGRPTLSGVPAPNGLAYVAGTFAIDKAVIADSGRHTLRVEDGSLVADVELRVIPAFFSILPPVLAIALALIPERSPRKGRQDVVHHKIRLEVNGVVDRVENILS